MAAPHRTGVAITGMGVACRLGEDVPSYADALFAGRCGYGPWREMDPRIESRVGGDMRGFTLAAWLKDHDVPAELRAKALKSFRGSPLGAQLVAAAALQAMTEAGTVGDPERFGHVMSAHNVNPTYAYENTARFAEEPEFIDPLFGLYMFDTDPLSAVSELFDLRGPIVTIGAACASGNAAVIQAMTWLRAGLVDRVLVTGVASDMDPVVLQGLLMMEAVAPGADDPEGKSRPFDVARNGFVPAEGAAALVLEREDDARARGAAILAVIRGGALTSSACRHSRPDRAGQARAIRLALADAGVTPEEITYVNAHGTSTPLGDRSELEAVRDVLGDRALTVPINATKSMLGHALQAAAVLEIVATVVQMRAGRVHGNRNLVEVDPALAAYDLPREARPADLPVVLKNAFGFGGINAAVVLARGDA